MAPGVHRPWPNPPKKLNVKQIYTLTRTEIQVRGSELEVDRWNNAYKFVNVMKLEECVDDSKLKDPTYLVISMPIDDLVTHRHKFLVSEMRTLASAHSIRYFNMKKMELRNALVNHECSALCHNIFYVFKELPQLKFTRPWNTDATMRRDRTEREISTPSPPNTKAHISTDTELGIGQMMEVEDQSDVDVTHLKPVIEEERLKVIRRWQKEMKLTNFIKEACAVCGELKTGNHLKRVQSNSLNLHLLRNDGLPARLRPNSYNIDAYDGAILDPRGLSTLIGPGLITVCNICRSDLKKDVMPRLALANWLYYAHDKLPQSVEEAFKDMTVFEKALVCRVRTSSILCRFSSSALDLNAVDNPFLKKARHIRGNVVSTPLNVPKMHAILPPSPSSIRDTVCALFVTNKPPTTENIKDLRPVLVRKSRVKTIIEFLLENNPHYHKSTGFGGLSSENLEALFEGEDDTGVPTAARIGYLPLGAGSESATASYDGRTEGLEGLFMENTSYTTGDTTSLSYREMCLDALSWCKRGRPFVASQSGSQPVPDINNPNWLSWAHPNVDPYGIGGFHEPRRKRPVSPEAQLRHMLNTFIPAIEADHELAFDVYNIMRKAMVNTSLRFMVPISAYRKLIDEIRVLDASRIEDLRFKYRSNPSYQPQTEEEKKITKLTTAITPIARGIPGSTAQRIKMRNEIRGIINQKGSPTLFITLNPADHHHPLVAVLASEARTADEIENLLGLGVNERMKMSLSRPAACATFFDMMIKGFIKIILGFEGKAGKTGLFGKCTSYYGTVETQGRGALHCHMLVWLEGHPPPEILTKVLISSNKYRESLKAWLESIMDSGFNGVRSHLNDIDAPDDEDLVKENKHPGTSVGPQIGYSQTKKWRDEIVEHTDDLLLRYNWHKHTGTCWKYLRPGEPKSATNCRFGIDGSRYPVTQIDQETGKIQIRRRHPRMTSYNPTATFLMKCNTDFKFIGTGEDAKAFMYYVTDYITKAPLSMYAGLAALSYAIRAYEVKKVIQNEKADDSEARRAMTIAVNSMLGHQEFSHPQVMAFLLGHDERYSSEVFQAVNWAEIITFVGAVMEEDAKNALTKESKPRLTVLEWTKLKMSVTKDRGKVSTSNQIMDYVYRPASEPFASMCLYKYLASAIKVPNSDGNKLRNKGAEFSSSAHPQFKTHKMKSRQRLAIPVLLGPNIKRKNASEEEHELWAREMVILFSAWRDPISLKNASESWTNTMDQVLAGMDDWEKEVMKNMTLLPEAKHARETRPHHRSATSAKHLPTNMVVDQDENVDQLARVQEVNIYKSAWENEDGVISEEKPEGELDIVRLLNKDTADMFALCYSGGHGNPEESAIMETTYPDSSPHGVEKFQEKDESTKLQKAYMDTWRHERERKKEDQKKHVENGATETRSEPVKEGNRMPDVNIDVVHRIKLKIEKEGNISPWQIFNLLVQERGILENREQLKALSIIAHHVIEGGDQLLMYVGGEGGTGKSYLISTIVMLFDLLKMKEAIKLGAFTGIAASLIGGQTLHSLLAINPSKKSSVTRKLTENWKGVKYLIIDEVSMIGASFLAKISARLRHANGDNQVEAEKPFGGVNLIFMGDFLQLTPPRQPSLFSHFLVQNPSFNEAKNANGLNNLTGAFLWRQVHKVVLLRLNKRQQDDKILAHILAHMRTDQDEPKSSMTTAQQLSHLRSRELATVYRTNPKELETFRDATIIVGNRSLRDAINVKLLAAHAKRLGQEVILYRATDRAARKELQGKAAKIAEELSSRSSRDYLGFLPIFKGMKVMITENISVKFKIMNGTEGTVHGVRYSIDKQGSRRAEVVFVQIDQCEIQAPGLPEGVAPIFPKTIQIPMPDTGGVEKTSTFSRTQIPIVPSYAITDYKSQGRTMDKAVVDLATARGQGPYVMLSRTRKLDGILILRWFQASKVTQRKPQELRNELARLEGLSRATDEYFEKEVKRFVESKTK